jgi:hypothetical protein
MKSAGKIAISRITERAVFNRTSYPAGRQKTILTLPAPECHLSYLNLLITHNALELRGLRSI